MDLAITLKTIRCENNLTQDQVAEALGITRSAYCGYEIGRRKMSIEMLETLSRFYRIPIGVFYEEDLNLKDNPSYPEKGSYGEYFDNEEDGFFENMCLSQLSKDEQNLVLTYRMLNKESKKAIRNFAYLQKTRDEEDE